MTGTLWERRKFFRIPISGKALLQHGEHLDGLYRLENLSIGGCMLSDGPDCKLGDTVGVTLHVDGEVEIELPAKVVRQVQADGSSGFGLCFTDTDPFFEDRIQDLVMRAIEREQRSEILVIHKNPERVAPLFDMMREVGQSTIIARTPRDAMAVLEGNADRIRMAIIAPVVGTSSARDIVKLILRRHPHVHCVLLSRGGVERLVGAIRSSSGAERSAWSLTRLRKVIGPHQVNSMTQA